MSADDSRVIGVVIIGRNEGERLKRCIAAARGQLLRVVYVDSGSTDGSIEWAAGQGLDIVPLDSATPFTAARARNEGFERLNRARGQIQLVQFIDGDCELASDWLDRAAGELRARPDVAAVCGRLKERHPEQTVYNRLMDIEWRKPVGEVDACGGIFMVRCKAFEEVGGFNADIPAGEEPDLCRRLRARNWKIVRLGHVMATHDAAITSFRQWWVRACRTGYASMDLAARHHFASDSPYIQHIHRARFWGLYLPAAAMLLGIASGVAWDWRIGILTVGLAFAMYLLQIARVALRMRGQGVAWGTALAYGWFMAISKWAELAGHRRYRLKQSDAAAKKGTRT